MAKDKIADERLHRLTIANEILEDFAAKTRIHMDKNHVVVEWRLHNGEEYRRRWQTRGQDFYPVWYNKWGHGGTASTALSQLVRWVQGRPVLPLATWKYWASECCKLLSGKAVSILDRGGYPQHVPCVLCHETINGSLDWWSLDGVSGPCCAYTSGCRQQPKGNA